MNYRMLYTVAAQALSNARLEFCIRMEVVRNKYSLISFFFQQRYMISFRILDIKFEALPTPLAQKYWDLWIIIQKKKIQAVWYVS